MKWLPPSRNFRERLAEAEALADPQPRIEALAQLAEQRLGFIETIQLDAALARAPDAAGGRFDSIKLAVLSSATIDHLLPPIRVAGLRRGLRISTYGGGFGLYRQELLDPNSALRRFEPNAILLSLAADDFIRGAPLASNKSEAEALIAAAIADIRALWREAKSRFNALVLQQSFLDRAPTLFGGLDALAPGAPARLTARLNAALADAAYEDGVLWLDAARASAREGLDHWHEPARWLQGKFEISPPAAGLYGDLVARLLGAARGKSRKCLVLDLDNTLWGGVIGDDGVEGIVLGQGSGLGEAHLALQVYAKALKERGIILAVCSKNELAIAESAFRDHPEMALKLEDFAVFAANWTNKADNLQAIAAKLNIGIDSLVFVDDNPVEREQVRLALPLVAVPEMPADPAHYASTLAEAGYFEAIAFTEDDRERAEQYAANMQRQALLENAGDMSAFLKQLDMKVVAGKARPVDLARVTQLINKTNQFNTTTLRRTEDEIRAFAADPNSLVLQFRLIDRMGDNGIVSVMVAQPAAGEPGVLDLANWVMSCRVFARQLEDEALNILVDAARALGAGAIRADFAPTAKNAVIANLFEQLGFSRDEAAAPGAERWRLDLATYAPRRTEIERQEQS